MPLPSLTQMQVPSRDRIHHSASGYEERYSQTLLPLRRISDHAEHPNESGECVSITEHLDPNPLTTRSRASYTLHISILMHVKTALASDHACTSGKPSPHSLCRFCALASLFRTSMISNTASIPSTKAHNLSVTGFTARSFVPDVQTGNCHSN